MEGGGQYNKFARCQIKVFENSQDFIKLAVENICNSRSISSCETLVISDLGSSQGLNSLPLIQYIIDNYSSLHKSNSSSNPLECLIYHEDQPANDFATLLNTINSTESYIHTHPNIYTSVISKSFYERILPSNHVDICVCFISLHWLSTLPSPLPGNMVCYIQPDLPFLEFSHPDLYLQFKTQAKHDLFQFLTHRSVELKEHGMMVLTMCMYPNTPYGLATLISKAVIEACKAGIITEKEATKVTLPVYFRTVDEIKECVGTINTLELIDIQDIPISYQFDCSENLIGFVLSVFKPCILSCIQQQHQTDTDEMDTIYTQRRQHLEQFITQYMIKAAGVVRPQNDANIRYMKVIIGKKANNSILPHQVDKSNISGGNITKEIQRYSSNYKIMPIVSITTMNILFFTIAMYQSYLRVQKT